MNCGKKVRNKRIRTAEGVVGHAEEGEAIGSKYVEDVGVLREAEPGVGLRRQLLQDPPCHRPRVPRHRAELCQHHRSPSHHRIQYRHLSLRVRNSETDLALSLSDWFKLSEMCL